LLSLSLLIFSTLFHYGFFHAASVLPISADAAAASITPDDISPRCRHISPPLSIFSDFAE